MKFLRITLRLLKKLPRILLIKLPVWISKKILLPFLFLYKSKFNGSKKTVQQKLQSTKGNNNEASKLIKTTTLHIIFFIGLFFAWAIFSKMDNAIHASGVFIPSSKKKILQSIHGGVVETVLSFEGDIVKKGQTLIKLEDKVVLQDFEFAKYTHFSSLVQKQRIIAEIERKSEIQLDDSLKEKVYENEQLLQFFENEKAKLLINLKNFFFTLDSMRQKIEKNKAEIFGLLEQIKNDEKKLKILKQDMKVLNILKNRKMSEYDSLEAVKKDILSLKSEISNKNARVNSLKKDSEDILFQMDVENESTKKNLAAELSRMDSQIKEYDAKMKNLQDHLDKTSIKSPVDGIITYIAVNGAGQNINQNMDVVEIIPLDDDLIVEAKVRPEAISAINTGLLVKIMPIFPDQKITKPIYGEVFTVANDIKIMQNGEEFFIVKIKFDKKDLMLNKKKIIPGMRADVFIKTGEKRFIVYLLEPIFFSVLMAFNG